MRNLALCNNITIQVDGETYDELYKLASQKGYRFLAQFVRQEILKPYLKGERKREDTIRFGTN